MDRTMQFHEMSRFFADREGAFRARHEEPIENSLPADVEEEEMAELWAEDRGNQGA